MVDSSQPSELGMLRPISMRAKRQRRISPQAGRALEILGHAIEYLVDETLVDYADAPDSWLKGRTEAIQLLMATNRQIYFECPEVSKLSDRVLEILCAKCPAKRKCGIAQGIWSLRCLIQASR